MHRPQFIRVYVFMALFSGFFMCWIFGAGATDVVNEGFIVTHDPPNARHLFGIAPTFWYLGTPLIACGLLVLAAIWFMRKWGIVLAILLHLVSIGSMFWLGLIYLDSSAYFKRYVILMTCIVVQFYAIYWFVRHWSLFRWIKFTSPDPPQIADNP